MVLHYKKRLLVGRKKIGYASYQQTKKEISKKTHNGLLPFGVIDYITKPTSVELDTFKFPEGPGKFSFPNDVTKTPSAQPKQAKIKPSEVPSGGIVEELPPTVKVPFAGLVPKPQVKMPGTRQAVRPQKVTIKEGSSILIYQKGSQSPLHVRVSGPGFAIRQQSSDVEPQKRRNWVQIPTRKKTLGESLIDFTEGVVKGTVSFSLKQILLVLAYQCYVNPFMERYGYDMPNPRRRSQPAKPARVPVHLITAGPKKKVKVRYDVNPKKGISHKLKKKLPGVKQNSRKKI
jgi:hypothetical protein